MAGMLQRHDLVWLSDGGWHRLGTGLPAAQGGNVERWRRGGWPVVVTRRVSQLPAGAVALGLPLPPDETGAKGRLALWAEPQDIAAASGPLMLADVLDEAPSSWLPALKDLSAACAERCLTVQVYGSLAFQRLTGLAYVRDGSDIDVLIRPASAFQADQAVALMSAYSARLPLDGEMLFPDGRAVAWKEWRQAVQCRETENRVLFKTLTGVGLALPSDLLGAYLSITRHSSC